MNKEKILNKKVVIELKKGNKFFGTIVDYDDADSVLKWITIKTNKGEEIISLTEVARVEVLE